MIEVVAAMTTCGGRFMVCRRPAGKANAGLWEFPGGKLETGETPQAALRRGAGSGYYASHYKYRVVAEADGGYTAVFLDCYQSLRAARQLPAARRRQKGRGNAALAGSLRRNCLKIHD